MDRRADTSDGPSGASPTVITERHDNDGDLSAQTDPDTQILPTTPVRAARAAVARAASAAKDVLANGKPPAANGDSPADAKDAVADEVPALPADTIGLGRDSSSFDRPPSASVSPGADNDWASADHHTSSFVPEPVPAEPALADTEPVEAESAVAETGTGWSTGGTRLDPAGGTPSAHPSTAKPSSSPEPTVTAAAFVWDPPEPAPTSASSAARTFLRSSTTAKAAAPPRTPPVTVTPPKPPPVSPAPAPGKRSKGAAKRSARQAHLTIARVEPWSVMKFSFAVSLIAFVILFVAVGVIYGTLSALGVFTSLQHVVQSVTSSQNSSGVNASTWFTASRVLGYTAILGAINVVLIMAMSTIGAVVYNLTSRLIGGVEVTLREAD